MATTQITVERISRVSSRSFDEVVAAMDREIGHPDMPAFWKEIAVARDLAAVERTVNAAVGRSGFMLFARLDHGQFLRKTQGEGAPRILRYIIGNPLIMQAMARHVPDAGSYAPVTILIDERPDGVHLSYDSMASLLAPYGSLASLEVARELDKKVDSLLAIIAQ